MSEQVDLTTIPISPNGDKNGDKAEASIDKDGQLVTVFHDKDNFNVKHPLQNKWTLWFTKPSSGKVSLFWFCYSSHCICPTILNPCIARSMHQTNVYILG